MDASLGPLFNLYLFSTGRRLFAVGVVRERAAARGFQELVAHADVALAHDRKTLGLDKTWAANQGRRTDGTIDVHRVDALVDRTLTALRDAALAMAAVAKPGDGLEKEVNAFLHEIFPSGLAAVTSRPFVEELGEVDRIVERLQGDLAPVVAELGLGRYAARLAEVAEEYRTALQAPRLQFSTVRAARARGQELLLEVVALIVGRYYQHTPDHKAARQELLGPILHQNEAIRKYLRTRRAVEDVDPATGEVDPDAPPSTPGSEGGEEPAPG